MALAAGIAAALLGARQAAGWMAERPGVGGPVSRAARPSTAFAEAGVKPVAVPGTGCSNWEEIRINTTSEMSSEACHAKCMSTDGCKHFGYKRDGDDSNGVCADGWTRECMLFRGDCQLKVDSCWTLYQNGGVVAPALEAEAAVISVSNTTCSNWQNIMIGTASEAGLDACRAKCASTEGCRHLGYKSIESGECADGVPQRCMLFRGGCERQVDNCWTLYQDSGRDSGESAGPEGSAEAAPEGKALAAARKAQISSTSQAPTPSSEVGKGAGRDARQFAAARSAAKANIRRNFGQDGGVEWGSDTYREAWGMARTPSASSGRSAPSPIHKTGCYNWAEIRIGTSSEVSADACHAKCMSTDGCRHFGYKSNESHWCEDGVPHECMLFHGECKRQRDDCWDLHQNAGALASARRGHPSPAALPGESVHKGVKELAARRARNASNASHAGPAPTPDTSCKNRAEIAIGEPSMGLSRRACLAKCRSTDGCKHFGHKPERCADGAPQDECVLFSGDCQRQPDGCWSLYLGVTPGVKRGTRCSNQKHILVLNTLELSLGGCRRACKSNPQCAHFGYMPSRCGKNWGKQCVLLGGECAETPDPCWDFYPDPWWSPPSRDQRRPAAINASAVANASAGVVGAAAARTTIPAATPEEGTDTSATQRPATAAQESSGTGTAERLATTPSTSAASDATTRSQAASGRSAGRSASTALDVADVVPRAEPPAAAWREAGRESAADDITAGRAMAAEDSPGPMSPFALVGGHAEDKGHGKFFGSIEFEVRQFVDFVSDTTFLAGVAQMLAAATGIARSRISLSAAPEGKTRMKYALNVAGLDGTGSIATSLASLDAELATEMLNCILERGRGHEDLVHAYSTKIIKITLLGAAGDDGRRLCSDSPSAWVDKSRKYSCADYMARAWCTSTGGYGASWKQGWGSFSDWGSHGVSPVDACCGCGGGANDGLGDASIAELVALGLSAGAGMLVTGAAVWCLWRAKARRAGTYHGAANAAPHKFEGTPEQYF